MKKKINFDNIVEKKLGIPPDYQYKALNNSNFFQSNWHANKLTAIESEVILNKKKSILDLGSGSGNFEIIYCDRVKFITAVDYHKEALDFLKSIISKNNIKNVKTINADIRNIDIIKNLGKYDLVILIDVIEHIKKNDAKKMIKNLKKHLAPGGKICIITPNYKSLWVYIEHILDKLSIVPHFGGHQHLAQYHPQNLTDIFNESGFKTEKMKSFNLLSFIVPFKKFSTLFCKFELLSNMKFGNLLLGVFKNENDQ